MTDPELQRLADACALGDAAAMLKLSEYLERKTSKKIQGSDMWLLRAAIYGDAAAQGRVKEELRERPSFLKNILIPYENFLPGRRVSWHHGYYYGYLLNAVGLLAFQPDKAYLLAGIDDFRIMVVWQEEDYEPPDEDGFGTETYYNMFCLDEFFQPIPEVPMLCNVSNNDIRNYAAKRYEEMLDTAKNVMNKRTKRPLWTEFTMIRD